VRLSRSILGKKVARFLEPLHVLHIVAASEREHGI